MSTMKIIYFLTAFLLTINVLQAQDYGLYWKYKDYNGAIAVSIPRWASTIATAFVEERDDRKLLRKIHKTRVLFFEEESPFTDRDMKRFVKKSKRRGLDELVTVRTEKTHVRILAKSKGNTIKKVVVLFCSSEGAGLVSLKGKFRLDEINKVIEKSRKEGKKKDGSPNIPDILKVPVIRA